MTLQCVVSLGPSRASRRLTVGRAQLSRTPLYKRAVRQRWTNNRDTIQLRHNVALLQTRIVVAMAAPPQRKEETKATRAARELEAAGAVAKPAAPTRPPQQMRSEQSLAKMIRAGRELIEQHANLDLVLIGDVIRIAGTSIGAFYGRFQDKDAFITAVLEAAVLETQAEADNLIWQDAVWTRGNSSDIVAAIIDYYVDACLQNRGMFKAVLRACAAGAPESNPMRALNHHLQALFVPALARTMPARADHDAELEIRIALQMVTGTLSIALLSDPGPLSFESDALKPQLTEMLRRLLRLT